MTTLEWLDRWRNAGIIADSQYAAIASLVRKERFSLFLELNALLYIGVIALAGGLAWTFKTYFENLGDVFILAVLSFSLLVCLYYCFSRGVAYSNAPVESPNLFFDYVLYFGCLVLAGELSYLEFRFQLMSESWDVYLLVSAIVFFVLAYRFDNRFVLSLGLSSLAGWFGLKYAGWSGIGLLKGSSAGSLGTSGLIYGTVIALAGAELYRQDIKKHFLDAYLHVAANVMLLAALSFESASGKAAYIALVSSLAVAVSVFGFRFRRFAFVAYGIVYGYAGISFQVLRSLRGDTAALSYFVFTGAIVIAAIAILARRFGREE
jgi:hypothetical protein